MAARSIQGPFLAFRSILEKSLPEEMCLELKTALKNVLKNVQEAFLPTPKIVMRFHGKIFHVKKKSAVFMISSGFFVCVCCFVLISTLNVLKGFFKCVDYYRLINIALE